MRPELDAIRLLGDHLGCGHTHPNTVCPFCHGGQNRDRSLAVSRLADGRLAYICYRASCGASGYIEQEGYRHQQPAPAAKERKLKPYTGQLFRLNEDDFNYFGLRFGITRDVARHFIRFSEDDRYALRITGPLSEHYGWVLREPWTKGTPEPHRVGAGYKAKTILHMEADVEPICVYRSRMAFGTERSNTVVVVEDQISALKLFQLEYQAVALLGTHLNMTRVRMIQRLRAKRVVFALDPDATDKAFEFARRWGLALPSVRVALLEKDIKDMDDELEICSMIGD